VDKKVFIRTKKSYQEKKEKKMRKKLTFIAILTICFVIPFAVSALACDKIVAFGDSLSDNGNADGYGFGVWSNGNVWLDYLADEMGVELEDRALGGAKTSGHESGATIYGLDWQVDQFLSETPVGTDLSDTLFVIWCGGNDFLFMGDADINQVIGAAITNISDAVEALLLVGAENILVVNLPDLGVAPLYNSDPATAAGATMLAQTFNDYLKQTMCTFADIFPKPRFFMVDSFELVDYVAAHPRKFKFTNVTDMDGAGVDFEGYLFWDAIHPTTATHKIVAAAACGQVHPWGLSRDMRKLQRKLRPLRTRLPFEFECRIEAFFAQFAQ
jgi:outer membrane lipase/esterase